MTRPQQERAADLAAQPLADQDFNFDDMEACDFLPEPPIPNTIVLALEPIPARIAPVVKPPGHRARVTFTVMVRGIVHRIEAGTKIDPGMAEQLIQMGCDIEEETDATEHLWLTCPNCTKRFKAE